ncbi:MAG: hypothetical protein ABI210_08260 [Abditibacteriaceae bacterium]
MKLFFGVRERAPAFMVRRRDACKAAASCRPPNYVTTSFPSCRSALRLSSE